MKFEEILPALKDGKKVRRKDSGWIDSYNYIYVNYSGYVIPVCKNFGDYILKMSDVNADDWEIVKEKKKVKLRDLTEEQYDLWIENNCAKHEDSCRGCPFQKVQCDNHESVNDAWYLNKDLYSDKFLDQEVEIED